MTSDQKLQDFSLKYLQAIFDFLKAAGTSAANNEFSNALKATSAEQWTAISAAISTGKSGKPFNLEISIIPHWTAKIPSAVISTTLGEGTLHIGGEIRFEGGILAYQCLTACICFTSYEDDTDNGIHKNTTYVVRRFHFDFDNKVAGKWPIKHLQVGGNQKNLPTLLGIETTIVPELFTNLDVPRLPFPIMDLASVSHMFLNSCNTLEKDITLETFWKKAIREFEKVCQKIYYQAALNNIEGNNEDTTYELFSKPITDLL